MATTAQDRTLTETQMEAFRTKVKEALWEYDEIDPELRDRVKEYLITGEDATCLLELPAAYQKQDRKKFFQQRQHNPVQVKNKAAQKKLAGLFHIDKPSAGYYQRLGEVAQQIPELAQTPLQADDRLPDWFTSLMRLRWVLHSEGYFMYRQAPDPGFQILPCWHDLAPETDTQKIFTALLDTDTSSYNHIVRYLVQASDWGKILEQYPQELAEALKTVNAHSREEALQWLRMLGFNFEPILATIVELAVSSSKKVRALAQTILRQYPQPASKFLSKRLAEGSANERGYAAEMLVALRGAEAESQLQAALEKETGQRVRQTLETLLASLQQPPAEQETQIEIELPPIEMPSGELPLPEGFRDQLWEQMQQNLDSQERQYEKQLEAYQQPDRPHWMQRPEPIKRIERQEFDRVLDYVEGKTTKKPSLGRHATRAAQELSNWSKWTDLSKLHLVHIIRLQERFGMISHRYGGDLYIDREDWIESHRAAQEQPYGLRELDAACATLPNIKPGSVAKSYLTMNNSWQRFLRWEPEAVWPLFVEHIDIFRNAILGVSQERHDWRDDDRRRNAIEVASMMPTLLPEVERMLFSVALGEGKKDRPAARRALLKSSQALSRALTALGDGKQAIRIAAAEMLAEIGDPAAIDPLKAALKEEKQDLVQGSFLQAIEKLGGSVDEFLGHDKLLDDAKKGLKKKRPKGMEWVPLDSLPSIRWAESNEPVPTEIQQWWVIQSIQFKLPVCGAVLRRSMEMCRRDDSGAFAKYLLSAWISYDTKAPTREEVLEEATKEAAAHWNSGGSWMKDYYKSEENYREILISQKTGTFLQSAIGQKGLLAIVSAAGNAECVKMIERYIRTYHGNRLAQSKALLETLAWIEDKTAIQLLLALGNRFRTKGIQKRAAEIVQELADRQGWSTDQLADRTIPDAGFEREKDENDQPIGERAELVVDYGSRKFSIILGDDLQAVITRDDGKTVKSLPAAAKDDDPELVKAAKSAFSAAKKTIKEVVKSQAERLYEAACTQRSWTAEEWQTYLAQHPIAGALCRRVVWVAQPADESQSATLFRPLEDGTLSDVEDNEFTLQETDSVLVAHSSLLDEETVQAWKQHLEDYEVPELFTQFGRPTYRLSEEKQKDYDIEDFKGHMVNNLKLASKTTKFNWQRGPAEDGGCYYTYHKPFRSQGVEAVLEYTGSYMGERTDHPAAIISLFFTPLRPDNQEEYYYQPRKLRLSEVPPVLLSECYNDVRDIAAEGTGFDPDWEKKGMW